MFREVMCVGGDEGDSMAKWVLESRCDGPSRVEKQSGEENRVEKTEK